MEPWGLTAAEWRELAILLQVNDEVEATGIGRPRIKDDRAIAEACLYRHYHARKSGYRSFGWNDLPKTFGVSPSTANRRFREWTENGSWNRFWHALLVMRHESNHGPYSEHQHPGDGGSMPKRLIAEEWKVMRAAGRFPIGDILVELERAYLFFDAHFFGKTLATDVAISVENGPTRSCVGYFCARVWNDGKRQLGHIMIHASVFGDGAEPVLAVLLHEMVHLRNEQVGIRDCHPRNQYHNRDFRDIAHLTGLDCHKRHPARGYADTTLDKKGREAVILFQPREELFQWKVH